MTAEAEKVYQIVENLVKAGWEFKSHTYVPVTKGWWVLPISDDNVKKMRRGDPTPFYDAAIRTAELYAPECM